MQYVPVLPVFIFVRYAYLLPYRDMASIVSEAEKAITNRFEILEPASYDSDARQAPKSPEWFMSASAKIKILAKNISR